MKEVKVIMQMSSALINVNGIWEDFCEAARHARCNLIMRYHVDIKGIEKFENGNAIIKLEVPENILPFNAGRHLRGISQYLLKHYPEKYEALRNGTRLFNYATLEEGKGAIMNKITVTVYGNSPCLKEFLNMCAWMELCGNIGHSAHFVVGYDGDGSARMNFKFGDPEFQEKFVSMQRKLLKQYEDAGDIEHFVLE